LTCVLQHHLSDMCSIFAAVSTLQKPNDHLPVFMVGRSGPVYLTWTNSFCLLCDQLCL